MFINFGVDSTSHYKWKETEELEEIKKKFFTFVRVKLVSRK